MRDRKSSFFILGFSLFVLWESLRLGLGSLQKPGSGFLSFCTGVILSVICLIELRKNWGKQDLLKVLPSSRRVIIALISLIVYSIVLETVGFIVATFFLVGIVFHLAEPRRWWALLGMSALVTLLVYLVFGILLQVNFPRGILGI